jgi:hypothetical protein
MITKGAAMFIIRHGQRIQVDANYVLRPGEALALPSMFMDADTREARRSVGLTDADIFDAYGVPAGHTRGFVFVADRSIRDAAAIAYEERNKYLQNAWRRRLDDHDQDQDEDERPPPPRTLADAQARAEAAYLDKIERLKRGWKNRDAA